MNKLATVSDDALAAELKSRGWHVYSKERVRVIKAGRAFRFDEWNHVSSSEAWTQHEYRALAARLGQQFLSDGCVVIETIPGRRELRGDVVWQMSAGAIVPRPKDSSCKTD